MQRCNAYVLAKRFDFPALQERLADRGRTTLHRDALHLEEAGGEAFLFPYGAAVLWGFDHDGEKRLLDAMAPCRVEPLEPPCSDLFTWAVDGSGRIHADHITLPDDGPLAKLAFSHALAQSVKLAELEQYAEQTIEESAHIPRNMAAGGRSGLGRREIARMRGRLFLVESDIHLHHGLLDTPEFFWEYPELEEFYALTATYLDVQPRIEVLNKKLQVIHDMFDMLADEQKHQHSSMLEWIIIWLIAIEIAIFLLHDLMGVI
ncbi:RMD1 family protein [Endothiovibrio diazotrophicus]